MSWNQAGDQLIVGDSLGRILLFKMKDNSSSEWIQNVLIDVQADPIVCLGWLHNGIKELIIKFK
jgi:hypothetical protein